MYLHNNISQKTGSDYLTDTICLYEQIESAQKHSESLINLYLPSTFIHPLTKKELENSSLFSLKINELAEIAWLTHSENNLITTAKKERASPPPR